MKTWKSKGAMAVQSYDAAVTPSQCPLCGSTSLLLDITRGQLVCTSCGYVVDDTVFDYTAYREPYQGVRIRRDAAVEVRARKTHLALMTSRARLTHRLGTAASEIIESMRSDPLVADEALRLLRNPCIRRLTRRLSEKLVAAFIKALLLYRRGEYPLYSEIALEHGLEANDVKMLKRLLKKAGGCIGISDSPAALLTPL